MSTDTEKSEQQAGIAALQTRISELQASLEEKDRVLSELRNEHERYRMISLAAREAFGDMDLTSDTMWCGRGMRAIFGVGEVVENAYEWWLDRIHPDDRERVRFHMDRLLLDASRLQDEIEYRVLTANNEYIYILFRIYIVRDPDGKPQRMIGLAADISNRKLMEEQSRRNEEALRKFADEVSDLYNNAPCGYHSLGPDGTFLKINQTELNWLGYKKEEIVRKRKWTDLLTPEGIKVYEATFPLLKERGWINDVELDLVRKDGSPLPIHLNATAIRDAQGNFIMTRSTLFDMTEHKKAEEELRESEQLYRTALESSNDGVTIHRNGTYVYANQKFIDSFGLTYDEVVGRPVGAFTHPEDRWMVQEITRRRLSGEPMPSRFEVRAMKRDGSLMYLEVSTTGIIYRGAPARLNYLRDITKRKLSEIALMESEEKYRTIIESIEDNFFEVDPAGNFTFVNEAACRTHGRTREEMLGLNNRAYTRPEEAGRIYGIFGKMYRTGIPVSIMDYEIIRKDGGTRYLELSASPIMDGSGKIIGARGMARDVTDRRRMEEEKKRLTERLNNAQKMEAIGTLAGGIAHDFNNILASIMGYTELVKIRLLQDELHGYLDQVLKSCARAKDLVNQILTFGKKREKEVRPVNMDLVVGEVLKLLRATLPATIEIVPRINPGSHTVLADATEMHQVLMNLSTNAAHAMRGKGGRLEISLDHVGVDEEKSGLYHDLKPGTYVSLTVADTGEGIEKENLGRIFDPFFTTKERGKGTGLGLSVVYGITQEYGGSVTVRSERGAGSTFSVYLPSIEQPLEPGLDRTASIPKGTETILFVDDEEMISQIGKEMLEHLGYDVVSTTSSLNAVELFRAQPERFHLVITDLTMPHLTGIDLARELFGIRPDIPIILSTGYSELITEDEARKMGIREFFMKPFSLEQMARGIRKALRR